MERTTYYQEYFEKRKPSAFGERIHLFWNSRMLDIGILYIPSIENKRILEVGPGFGYLAQICRKRNFLYTAVEMNESLAENLRIQGFDITISAIPPFPAGDPVQIIWMSNVLEHASTFIEARQMLIEAYKRLDPLGYIVIISPDLHSWKTEFFDVDWSHGYPTTLKRIEQLLQETGFEVICSKYHTATFINSPLVFLLSLLFKLVPYKFLDLFVKKFTGRNFFYSFMVLFGWRQIYIIGLKPSK